MPSRPSSKPPSNDAFIRGLKRRRFSPFDLVRKDSLVEKVLAVTLADGRLPRAVTDAFQDLLERFESFPTDGVKTVVFGGGSGLSSIVGGDNRVDAWAAHPFRGLKNRFEDLTVAVCTTDDGGSTGRILRHLELIAVGDYRKVCLSMIKASALERRYAVRGDDALVVVRALQRIINHRFPADVTSEEAERIARDPRRLLAPAERKVMPAELAGYLKGLGALLLRADRLAPLSLGGNCLGNLYLVAAIYRRVPAGRRTPGAAAVVGGAQEFATHLGAPGRDLFPATSTPGQLRYLYGNGVTVSGQNKAMRSRRGFPVERVAADYLKDRPHVSPKLIRAIREADLILFAPGSIFSSLIPILQIESVTNAIRANRKALKVLAGNFWVQEGETDISRRGPGARYSVADMISAYDRNVPGGVTGVFTQILVADLQQLPGHVLRNYALEGKLPIFLDRERVTRAGFEPIEAPVFARDVLETQSILHHDPERFALAVKTLLFMRGFLRQARRAKNGNRLTFGAGAGRRVSSAAYMATMEERLDRLDLRPGRLRARFTDLIWRNRDIRPAHLDQLRGVRVVPARRWKRSTAWDRVLGYFDPTDGYVKVHEQLMRDDPDRLAQDLLIGLGEALLGRYFASKHLEPVQVAGATAGTIYSVRLAPIQDRGSFLSDAELRAWLDLAGMKPSAEDADLYRILVNRDEGFMPPGLMFGILYAWYLDNRYGGIADHEMSLIRWRGSDLVPHQSRRMQTRRKRIAFLRRVVFGHDDPDVEAILAAARSLASRG